MHLWMVIEPNFVAQLDTVFVALNEVELRGDYRRGQKIFYLAIKTFSENFCYAEVLTHRGDVAEVLNQLAQGLFEAKL